MRARGLSQTFELLLIVLSVVAIVLSVWFVNAKRQVEKLTSSGLEDFELSAVKVEVPESGSNVVGVTAWVYAHTTKPVTITHVEVRTSSGTACSISTSNVVNPGVSKPLSWMLTCNSQLSPGQGVYVLLCYTTADGVSGCVGKSAVVEAPS